MWSSVLRLSWKWRHRLSHTVPLGKREVLQVEAGSTNTFKMEFDKFPQGLCDKAAVILERKLKLDLWRR